MTLLALLKHPRFRLGAAAGGHHRAIAALELAVLRGPRPSGGTGGLAHALVTFRANRGDLHRSDPRKRISAADLDAAQALVELLRIALAPFETALATSFAALAARHADALRALSADDTGAAMAFAGDDGEELARAFDEIAEQNAGFAATPGDYAELFEAAIADRVCAAPDGRARACVSTAPSRRACSLSIGSCSAGWSRACGRPRRAPIHG